MNWRLGAGLVLLAPLAGTSVARPPARHFFIKNGDRVCFFGASITKQRFYPVDIETYVLTRYPKLQVRFLNAGVGGDGVAGGWAGPMALRLRRDVFPFKPNVVTINDLPMNDTQYRPFNRRVYQKFCAGYVHLIKSLKKHLPGVRIVLILPPPYDDITHATRFPGGINGVLLRYCKFIRQVAAKYQLPCVNMNRPLVQVITKANKINVKLARQIIPGRLHPSAAGHLVMAQALLQAWGARARVTSVTINAQTKRVVAEKHTDVKGLKITRGALSWTQTDRALPMPVMSLHENWPQFPPVGLWPAPLSKMATTNPVTALTIKLSGFMHALDRQPLRVTHLPATNYILRIDGHLMGQFTRAELAHGVNLARLPTPMLMQSYKVMDLAWQRTQTRFTAWRQVELPMANIGISPPFLVNTNTSPAAGKAVNRIMHDFQRLQGVVIRAERQAARCVPHRYALVPGK